MISVRPSTLWKNPQAWWARFTGKEHFRVQYNQRDRATFTCRLTFTEAWALYSKGEVQAVDVVYDPKYCEDWDPPETSG
jgi:hypothetical protein